jgi:hypothetical protein
MQIFLANGSDCRMLANVGCCYHYLDEEFYRNPKLTNAENDACNERPAFPLSSTLRKAKFRLGRNARMLSAQPTNRMADSREVSE